MPYIKPNLRPALMPVTGVAAISSGELNYQITCLLTYYLDARGLSYHVINDIVGALEGAKQEFYQRVAVPYEEEKRAANGDVY